MFFIKGNLRITESSEVDQGSYECVAENKIGTEYSYSAQLYVKGKVLNFVIFFLFYLDWMYPNRQNEIQCHKNALANYEQIISNTLANFKTGCNRVTFWQTFKRHQ